MNERIEDRERELHWEENAGRLLRSGYGAEARPDPALRAQLLGRLRQELCAAREPFPDAVLGGLGGLWVATALGLGLGGVDGLLADVARVWLAVNLALVPIAGVMIFQARRAFFDRR